MINLLAICHTTPQDLINTWGERKYGVEGEYSITIDGDEKYFWDTFGEHTRFEVLIKVCRGGQEVDTIKDPNFCQLLNEILGGK